MQDSRGGGSRHLRMFFAFIAPGRPMIFTPGKSAVIDVHTTLHHSRDVMVAADATILRLQS